MIKFFSLCLVLQSAFAYHSIRLSPDDIRFGGSQGDDFANFNKFDDTVRSARKTRQFSGFNWDSDSGPPARQTGRRPSTFNNNFNFQQRGQDDGFIFDDNEIFNDPRQNIFPTTGRTPTSTFGNVAIPGMGTTRLPCEDRCQTTPEYNPVCGDDNMTYFSPNRLKCAQNCGKRVNMRHLGACSIRPPRG